ncbi:MAG TPA: alpha/beta hydrolase [Polyangia bacterium]|nr:alpha/beta hydrolase [Polyangia bacterium]
MRAYHFGGDGRTLFGVLHEPARLGREGGAVVVCAPLWREAIRSHRVLRQLGLRLAKDGRAVLRFDYSGAGDSAGDGEHGDVETWVGDVIEAIDEARRECEVERVTLLGLRFGATLAALAAARRDDVERIVLWEPVVDGASYLEAGFADHRAWAEAYASWRRLPLAAVSDAGDEILGFRVTEAMRASIAGVKLTRMPTGPARLLVVERQAPDPASPWSALGARVEHKVMAEPEVWKQHHGEGTSGARQTCEVIATWLARSES